MGHKLRCFRRTARGFQVYSPGTGLRVQGIMVKSFGAYRFAMLSFSGSRVEDLRFGLSSSAFEFGSGGKSSGGMGLEPGLRIVRNSQVLNPYPPEPCPPDPTSSNLTVW